LVAGLRTISGWLGSGPSRGPETRLDGEACAGDGHEGIQAVFEERNRDGGDMSFLAFDLLTLKGQEVMREPWTDRRKRLEDLFGSLTLPRVGLVPVTEDAAALYERGSGRVERALCPSNDRVPGNLVVKDL
jgi:ATP-dependent DNA ligase